MCYLTEVLICAYTYSKTFPAALKPLWLADLPSPQITKKQCSCNLNATLNHASNDVAFSS